MLPDLSKKKKKKIAKIEPKKFDFEISKNDVYRYTSHVYFTYFKIKYLIFFLGKVIQIWGNKKSQIK